MNMSRHSALMNPLDKKVSIVLEEDVTVWTTRRPGYKIG
jgi:hypothetical protein